MLSDFLFDIENSKEQNQFKFNGTLVCSEPVPPIIVRTTWKWNGRRWLWCRWSDVNSGAQAIQHQLFYGLSSSVPPPTEYLPAKVWEYRYHLKDCYIHNHQDPSNVNEIILQALIDTIIEEANLSSVAFATSPVPKILYLDEPEPVEYSKVHILDMLKCHTMRVIVNEKLTEMVQIYEAWETDKIISVELWRNLSLCLFAVAGVSLMLLGDFRYTRSDPDFVIIFNLSHVTDIVVIIFKTSGWQWWSSLASSRLLSTWSALIRFLSFTIPNFSSRVLL